MLLYTFLIYLKAYISRMAASALVQGASRGIGLQFCRTLLSRSPDVNVLATCRSPSSAQDLQELNNQMQGRLHVLQVDVSNESQIQVKQSYNPDLKREKKCKVTSFFYHFFVCSKELSQ